MLPVSYDTWASGALQHPEGEAEFSRDSKETLSKKKEETAGLES